MKGLVSACLMMLIDIASAHLPPAAQHILPCRSKLAGVWNAYELQRRRPDLIVPVLHPGVVATNLADAPRCAP